MSRARALLALLACAAMAASGALHAQARGLTAREMRSSEKTVEARVEKQPLMLDEATRATKIAEMEAWLRGLVGRFRVDGKMNIPAYPLTNKIVSTRGTADCVGIGEGPGVRCILRNSVPVPPEVPLEKMRPDLELPLSLPTLLLGIDPDTLEIQLVLVSDHVDARSGPLMGDTVFLTTDTWKACEQGQYEVSDCYNVREITAKPAGDVFMKLDKDQRALGRLFLNPALPGHTQGYDLHLHRELPVDAKAPRDAP